MSSKVIFTSDNPRTEHLTNYPREWNRCSASRTFKKTCQYTDRKQAIKTACQLAQPNDIILVAGKGHETYQEINGNRNSFDDYKIVEDIFKKYITVSNALLFI